MSIQHKSHLVSNHENWELIYKDRDVQPLSQLRFIGDLVTTAIAWPMCFLLATVLLPMYSFSYVKARRNQYKILNVLSNPKQMEEYTRKRIQVCEARIENLKSMAIQRMERKPALIGLPIPQKQGILDSLSKIPDHWKDFPWYTFMDADFFQKSKDLNDVDKHSLQNLEQIRKQMSVLSHQKEVLLSPGRLEIIKKIAEMSFIKNAFKRQESKEWIFRSILWLVPFGFFVDERFNLTNDRITYEGKKNFLPNGPQWKNYKDLVDAHNQLVRRNDFVVPYVETEIV